jgi:hypothetical protein
MKLRPNQIAVIITAITMLLMFAFFSYFNSSLDDVGDSKEIVISTTTPQTSLVRDGWWSNIPTPIQVAPAQIPSQTPSK